MSCVSMHNAIFAVHESTVCWQGTMNDGSSFYLSAGVFVHSIATGEGGPADSESSFFGSVNSQVCHIT